MSYAPPLPFHTWYSRATSHSCVPPLLIGQDIARAVSALAKQESWIYQYRESERECLNEWHKWTLCGWLMSDCPMVHCNFVNGERCAVLRWLTHDCIHKAD